MPLPAVLLILVAALVHGYWNLLLKREGGRADVTLGAVVTGVVLGAPVFLVCPVASVPPEGWLLMLLAALLETGYMVALTAAYAIGDLSLVYPVARGTAPIIVAPLAFLLLGERPSAPGLAGVGLVVVGIFASHVADMSSVRRSTTTRRALGLAIITGLMTSGYSVVNKLGVALVPVPIYGVTVFAMNAVFFTLVLKWRGTPIVIGRAMRWRPMLTIGALMMTSYILILAAMSMAPVTYVVAAREVSIVVGAALGAIALRERHPIARIAGAIVIFAGVALLALAR